MSYNSLEIESIMEQLSKLELSQILGGALSECDMLIIAANSEGSTWTDQMWDDWNDLYDKHCAKVDFVYDPTTGQWVRP